MEWELYLHLSSVVVLDTFNLTYTLTCGVREHVSDVYDANLCDALGVTDAGACLIVSRSANGRWSNSIVWSFLFLMIKAVFIMLLLTIQQIC